MYAVLLRGLIILLEQDLKKTHDLAASRLEREAKRRGMTADLLLASIIEVLGIEDLRRTSPQLGWYSSSARSQACGRSSRGTELRHEGGRSMSGGHQFVDRKTLTSDFGSIRR